MSKFVFAIVACLLSASSLAQSKLTDIETRWLHAGEPVLAYAKQIGLPLDIIVQPQAGPNDVPFAMGFDGGRCKLVLSMRGNPKAEAVLDGVPEERRALLIEAMSAHEVGHCWRYAKGEWHALPAGFVEVGDEKAADPALLEESKVLRETRREEAFADLVALAWVKRRHPGQYDLVYAWLESVRHERPLPGSSHDTLGWLHLARESWAFQGGATPFEQAMPLWRKGLVAPR